MKPPVFDYFAPTSLDEVLSLLAKYGSDSRVIAGGQSLVPLMNFRMVRPDVLIDLNRVEELRFIERTKGGLSYGAMVRQIDAEKSDLTRAHCSLVAKGLAHAGPVAVRTRATVGGTIAHADRVAELPGVAVAMGATMIVAGVAGKREVPVEEFFQGDMTTAIGPQEMLHSVRFPAAPPNSYCEFLEVGIRREGVALVGLAAQIEMAEKKVAAARLAVVGIELPPIRLRAVEDLLEGQMMNSELAAAAAALASKSVEPLEDAMAPPAYRRRVTGSLVRKILESVSQGERH